LVKKSKGKIYKRKILKSKMKMNLILKIPKKELEDRIKGYLKRGYEWRPYFDDEDLYPNFQIYKQGYSINSQEDISYFSNLKKLEIGNKEQIQMKECLDLIALLLTARYLYIYESGEDDLLNFLDSSKLKNLKNGKS
jgi:hypothetical protein